MQRQRNPTMKFLVWNPLTCFRLQISLKAFESHLPKFYSLFYLFFVLFSISYFSCMCHFCILLSVWLFLLENNFIEKRLQHRDFYVNFTTFLKMPFSTKHLRAASAHRVTQRKSLRKIFEKLDLPKSLKFSLKKHA